MRRALLDALVRLDSREAHRQSDLLHGSPHHLGYIRRLAHAPRPREGRARAARCRAARSQSPYPKSADSITSTSAERRSLAKPLRRQERALCSAQRGFAAVAVPATAAHVYLPGAPHECHRHARPQGTTGFAVHSSTAIEFWPTTSQRPLTSTNSHWALRTPNSSVARCDR